jgi:hypothetical protein
MKPDNQEATRDEQTVISIIQAIKDGLDPRSLEAEDRQRCVDLLHLGEGQSISQVAELFRCCEKTVQRDLKVIRKRKIITTDVEFSRQLESELYHRALNHANFLMRLARSKEAKIDQKIAAELGACKVFVDLVEKFQSFGCLPSRPQQIAGDVYHHFAGSDGETNIAELKQMVLEIEQSAKEAGTFDEKTEASIKELKVKIAKLELSYDVTKLLDDLNKAPEQKEDQNESEHQK